MSDTDGVLDLVVVGGGIAGLATAFHATKDAPQRSVVVLEAGDDVGGKVGAAEVAGARIDRGPDMFLARVPGMVDLCADLGLDDLVSPATGKAWLWSRGRLRSLPEGLVLGVPSRLGPLARSGILSPLGLARAALDEVLPRPARSSDVSVSDAIGGHLGREVVERFVDPLLGGINASDCDALSIESSAPTLVGPARAPRLMRALRETQAVNERGQIGVEAERPVFLTPRTGVRTVIDTLRTRLGDRVRTRTTATALGRSADGTWQVSLGDGTLLQARRVALAVPASVAAGLLARLSPSAAAELRTIRTASVGLAILAYPAAAVDMPPGSGMLVPRPEHLLMTASSWWHQKWPHLATPGHVLIRASAGRDGDQRFVDLDDDELAAALHRDLVATLGIRSAPVDQTVARWMGGFPQYDVGHGARVQRIEASLAADAPGLEVVGAPYRGIGLPACVRDAQRAAAALTAA